MKKTGKLILSMVLALVIGAVFSLPAAASAYAKSADRTNDLIQTAPNMSSSISGNASETQSIAVPGSFHKSSDSDYNVTTDGGHLSLNKTNYVDLGTSESYQTTATLMVKPTKTGALVAAAAGAYDSSSITLLNSSKKALSGETYVNVQSSTKSTRFVTYGITAGKTYYLKIYFYTPMKTDDGSRYYGIVSAKNLKYTAKAGKSKKKAVKLKRKKTVKGVLTAGSSKSKWYKFTTKNKKSKIRLEAASNDSIKLTIYQKVGKKTNQNTRFAYRDQAFVYTGTVSKKAKQTYWIKVTPMKDSAKKPSSGIYIIKWTK